jgi:hypothetical protein
MKRETTAARFERLERRLRRVQAISISAVALMACAMLAQRGASQQDSSTGSFEELTVKKLKVDSIMVSGHDTPCDLTASIVCISGKGVWSPRISTINLDSITIANIGDIRTPVITVGDGAGTWTGNMLMMQDPNGPARFIVTTGADPVLTVTSASGKTVTVPVQPPK